MKLTSFLAYKFLTYREKSFFVSFLTWMAVLGVLVSVAAFIIVEGVMTGFSQDLQEKILGFSPHVILPKPEEPETEAHLIQWLKSNGQVSSWSSFVEGEAVMRTEEDMQGVRIRGMDPNAPPTSSSFQVFFEEGETWENLNPKGENLPGILLGDELARDLGILPFLQEKIELLYPFGEVGPSGELEPNRRYFRVIGTFKSGFLEYDRKFVLIERRQAERLFGDSKKEQIGIFLKKPLQAPSFAEQLKKELQIPTVQPWTKANARLFSALKLERIGMSLVLGLMTLLASFNILSMLTMLVYERKRDLVLLRALGLNPAQVGVVIFKAGLSIGLVGGTLGVGLGILAIQLLSRYPLPLPSSYYLDALPVSLAPGVLLATFALALGLTALATWVPVRAAKEVNIIEGLHYE